MRSKSLRLTPTIWILHPPICPLLLNTRLFVSKLCTRPCSLQDRDACLSHGLSTHAWRAMRTPQDSPPPQRLACSKYSTYRARHLFRLRGPWPSTEQPYACSESIPEMRQRRSRTHPNAPYVAPERTLRRCVFAGATAGTDSLSPAAEFSMWNGDSDTRRSLGNRIRIHAASGI